MLKPLYDIKRINKTVLKKDLTRIMEESVLSIIEKEQPSTVIKQVSKELEGGEVNFHPFSNNNITKLVSISPLSPAKTNTNVNTQSPDFKKKLSLFSDIISQSHIKTLQQNQSPGLTPTQILKTFNLNPNRNYKINKKNFLYQIKISLLQVKKLCLSRQFQTIENKTKMNYYEIFSNYSNIKVSNYEKYERFDDDNIQIGNYIVFKSKVLGKGGYSTVYLCQELNTNKEYAVKVTEKNVRANKLKKKYDYVKEEVTILKRLHSQYIVQIYEIIETNKEVFIIMEYMKNNSLFNTIKTINGFQV